VLLNHIKILASDSFGGRATGTLYEAKAAKYIVTEFKTIGLIPLGNGKSWFQKFDFNAGTHGKGGRLGKAQNVIGYLNNRQKYTVVIPAHYDHLGDGTDGHSLQKNAEGKIYNGADDNAPGVSGLIGLARYFAGNKLSETYNFLFIAFSGE